MAYSLVHQHDPWLVLVAALICAVAATTVFGILDHVRGDKRHARWWIALAGLVSGVGIWATHFVAMLAYDPGVSVGYDPWLTAASVTAGLLLSTLGWWLAVKARPAPAAVAGTVIAAAICSMHYLGMAALELPGQIDWDRPLVAASLAVAAMFSIGSVILHRRGPALFPWRPALCFVLAICSLHFTGMGALTVHADHGSVMGTHLVDRNGLAALVIAGSTLLVGLGFFVLLFGRISDRERAAARVAHHAYHDTLTGLANRLLLGQDLAGALAEKLPLAVICIDLDGFKAVNDRHGHATGDALLVAVSGRLRELVRDSDLVARTGGDEFVIVQRGGVQPGDAAITADRMVCGLKQPFTVNGTRLNIGASAGIAFFPQDADCTDELMLKADAALYRAKRAGGGVVRHHDQAAEQQRSSQNRAGDEFAAALGNREIGIHYQPVAALDSGAVTGFEALLRWDRPGAGPVSPADLLAIAEDRGLVARLSEVVLARICAEAAAWEPRAAVSINCSSAQLLDDGFVTMIADCLRQSGLDSSRLEIEVTERVLLGEPQRALRTFHAIRALGVRCALDEFGTGLTSLGHLHEFPFDTVKIDRKLVATLGNRRSYLLARSIIELARGLGIRVVAAGVETPAQVDLLRALDCPLVQGYLIGRPARSVRVKNIAALNRRRAKAA